MTCMTGLLRPLYEHDSCGLGFVARVDGRRTRETVEEGLEVLRNLEHRGTSGSDPETGDGAGILTQIPDAFFRRECKGLGIELPPAGSYGVGTLEYGLEEGRDCEGSLERIVAEEGQRFLGFRDVPTAPEHAGRLAQGHAAHPAVLRRAQGTAMRTPSSASSTSSGAGSTRRSRRRTTATSQPLVAEGDLQGPAQGVAVARFYPDLGDPGFASAISLVHERFSTNTLQLGAGPSLPVCRPQRGDQHPEGERQLDARPREQALESPLFGE